MYEPSNKHESKTYVTSFEKPIQVTIPTRQSGTGLCYAGIKESSTDPWRYFAVSDQLETNNIISLRAVNSPIPGQCTFNIHRFTQFAVAVFDNNGNKLPETAVDSIVASSTNELFVKDGFFTNDLELKGILKGRGLNSLNASDFRARITYRNNSLNESPIKVNGTLVTQNNSKDKTVPGYEYLHSFVVEPITEAQMMGSGGEFAFTLNLTGIETQLFSDGILIEFFNKVSGEKVLPFFYPEFYRLNKKDVLNIAVTADSGKTESGLYELNPTFTLGIGRTLADSDKEKIESAISVSGVESEKITKTWEEDNLIIGFADELEQDTTYIISVSDITDIEGVSITDVEDITFTTKRVNNSFAISYNLDGGSLAVGESNPTTYDEASATITLYNPTKTGYTFAGWSGSNGETPQTSVTIEQGSTGDKAYTAHWSEVAYIITYNLDGGSETSNPTGYNIASETFVLNEPTKVGYTFLGWTGSNGDIPQSPVSIVQGSIGNREYTANFVPTSYTITYNLNDGTVATANPTTYDVTSATIPLNNPTRDGYTFAGWTGSNGDEPQTTVSIEQGSTGDKTFTAHWSEVAYTITYNLDGGTETTNPTGYNVASETFALYNPTKTGYSFVGWSGTGIDGIASDVTILQGSTGDREYAANWSINSYRLDLIAGTGINTVTGDGMHEYDSSVTASCTMLAGYEFDSWSGDITSETFNMPANNATMTANAKPIVYTISYNLASGTVATANPATYDITSATITINNPVRDGFNFLGWEGTDIAESTASDSLTIPTGSIGNRTYVASWTPAIVEVYSFTLAEGVTLEMRRCPAGTFIMGSPESEVGRSSNENQHSVTISKDFYMGTYEVTQAQYRAIMGSNPSYNTSESENVLPVENVSWNDIMTDSAGFIDKINTQLSTKLPSGYKFDLPTEAQWEYACRAGTTTALNNGKNLENASALDSNLSEVAWYYQNWGQSNSKTHSVGALASNSFGLYDMHGNVWEWCKDWYASKYYTTCGDCTDPVGPETGSYRVRRGGSWCDYPSSCRSAYRSSINPTGRGGGIGFRLVLVPSE